MRIAVVAWSMGLNAVGRGWLLADVLRRHHEVQLVGPLVAPWRSEIWPPLRESDQVRMRVFPAHDVACYADEAARIARSIDADVAYVSKPRLPSALLGELLAERHSIPLLLDIDDDESQLSTPEDPMRRAALEIVSEADAISVSSLPLQRRFGGTVVPQARDESVFDPRLYDRDRVRAELGFRPDETMIQFLGTPRQHKGVLDVARAVQAIPDPRVRMCMFGHVYDPNLAAELEAIDPGKLRQVGWKPISALPRLVAAGDLVCLPQDRQSPVAQLQMPVKVTDALAMEVPVLATETAALEPLIEAGAIAPIGDQPLDQRITELLADPQALRDQARRGRAYFLRHLGYGAAGEALEGMLGSVRAPDVPARRDRVLVTARDSSQCPVGGPAGHFGDDVRFTGHVMRKLAGEVRGAVAVVLKGATRCALLGYPNHGNTGDHAIWLAAKRILRALGIEIVYECDWQTYSRDSLADAVRRDATILFTGGDFGDRWPHTHALRERVLADFRGAPTVQLPASVHFESGESLERVQRLLDDHGNVRMMVRDPASLARARHCFHLAVEQVPDLAFATPMPRFDGPPDRAGEIIWVARGGRGSRDLPPPNGASEVTVSDWTQGTPADAPGGITLDELPEEMSARLRRSTSGTRTLLRGEATDEPKLWRLWQRLSENRLGVGCELLRRGQVVVTDRLHVHLAALHMGLPCVVSGRPDGDLRATYDTHTAAAPIAAWADSASDALELARERSCQLASLENAESPARRP
jgi:exopolysaccharide biosynthesis predicted pyruvyltransferase EpsI/glycosyltransferase involved in cell wall biosynthesis